MVQTRTLIIAAALLAGVGAVAAGAYVLLPRPAVVAAPSAIGGPFQLVDQDGRTVTDRDLRGSPFLVFFGFTHCPDVCPTALSDLSQTLEALGPSAEKMNVLFVTVDPERDTSEVLKSYLGSFHPRIRGMTGSPEQVAAMTKAYRAYSRKVPTQGGDYTMDHTAIVYLMDKDGAFVAPFNLKRPPAESAAELQGVL